MTLGEVLASVVAEVEFGHITAVIGICRTAGKTLVPVRKLGSVVVVTPVEEEESLKGVLLGDCTVVVEVCLKIEALGTE